MRFHSGCGRLALGFGALAAAVAGPACAGVGGSHPWCVIVQDQDDGWYCAFDTFEQCRAEARAGNTGFCAGNPFYVAPAGPARPVKRRRVK
ncbi:MAG TPA: DUF3551 domain-containing protein [Xanthobacteraceae bacterium]|nr:DUF3551 domain-containing protein [Xanthobacteraceae bacterium]